MGRERRRDVAAAETKHPRELARRRVGVARLFLLPRPLPLPGGSSLGDDVVHARGREGGIGERVGIILILLDQNCKVRALVARRGRHRASYSEAK